MKDIKILLIEDNPDDVELLRELFLEANCSLSGFVHTSELSVALDLLKKESFEIVLLDISLPDSSGSDTFFKLRDKIPNTPIIVITGNRNETMIENLLQNGAQDYLIKGLMDSNLLWRSVNYAIDRKKMLVQLEQIHQRERQEKEIASLKRISSSSQTEITAQFLGITSLKMYAPDIYNSMSLRYSELLDRAIENRIYKVENNISDGLRSLSEELGFLKTGPRDVIEIHTGVMEKKCRGAAHLKAQAYIEEGRIMLLELMGDIITFYRNYYVEAGMHQKGRKDAFKR